MKCQNWGAVRYGVCRNPRCSLPCRCNFAIEESILLTNQLLAVSGVSFFVYFGNLKVRADISADNHRTHRKAFQRNIRTLCRENNCTTRIYCHSEIGDDLRIHDHYAMYSDAIILPQTVKRMWDHACRGLPTTVHHNPPHQCIEAAVKYMCKDRKKDHNRQTFIRLFLRNTLNVTWGSRKSKISSGFFIPPKGEQIEALRRSRR